MNIYNFLLQRKNQRKKTFALLIDPDKISKTEIPLFLDTCIKGNVDIILIGGSLMINSEFDQKIQGIKDLAKDLPVVIFPGGLNQISKYADAILYLSLISGRNAEYLIGNQVIAAPIIKHLNLEAIATAYLLIESGQKTSVEFMSGTSPIPRDKTDIAVAHAMAAELLGFKLLYLEAGSGAKKSVPELMIKTVCQSVKIPVMVGGGIKSPEVANDKMKAGADIIVVGNHFEKTANNNLIKEFAKAIHDYDEN
jgi:phosphoglycerol geranylgeranyltransferase